ncbi:MULTISPECIES: hypothetical protein [unclassified Beijerinckia]|uniref:hypothetical protein n=1 Tax=unclassified Beijerinckia TaxID=2638183 RepID=UPI00089B42BB|nr:MULTISPECIES: hypothetical protein [unclassified Beijerinckia]MDH7798883.1 putative RNA methylase [Beijerinckia sp. GAS462]SED88066.1 hypothetical protein SAMN05443249_5770 [Beijerinckia sp. 28-YEA-48]
MQVTLMIVAVLHVLPAVFWAGTTFMLARTAGAGAEQLAIPQMGAAAVTVIAGVALWVVLHLDGSGTMERVLAVGAGCAIVAAGLQALSLPAVWRLRTAASEADAAASRGRIAIAQRVAAGLLAVAVVCMAVSRYV